jgi:tRNA U54 and U55 pseudouridine synthase Pus10
MEELKKLIAVKAGITEAQAETAFTEMEQYVKQRLPKIAHASFESAIKGVDFEDSVKSQVAELGKDVKLKAEGLADDLKTAFENAFKSKK